MPEPREQFLRRQREWLGPWAIREDRSGGRAVDEPPHPYRTCFQRDRDRIVHCSAFRRLDFKTQVFVPHEHDHFRTRMTHTLEVAQIGRTVARALHANEDLVEAVALAHDLGHPPFGHAGEKVLEELMADHGHFEHNRQSLRVVDYLEHPYPPFRGLNLTRAVRECLARHETRYDAPVCAEFDTALAAPLEGQIADVADEIAYTAADLDDALAAGWIDADALGGLALWRHAWAEADAEYPDVRAIHKQIRACKAILAAMVDDLIATTARNLQDAGAADPDDVRRAGKRTAGFSDAVGPAIDEMQAFLLRRVYTHPVNLAQDRLGSQLIGELFAAYVDDPSRLPERYRRRIDTSDELTVWRVACDYIAGMTDRFCRNEHARLCGGASAPGGEEA